MVYPRENTRKVLKIVVTNWAKFPSLAGSGQEKMADEGGHTDLISLASAFAADILDLISCGQKYTYFQGQPVRDSCYTLQEGQTFQSSDFVFFICKYYLFDIWPNK